MNGFRTAALLLVIFTAGFPRAEACDAPPSGVAGVWRLVEARTTHPDGRIEHPYGQPPAGLFVYTPGGHLSLHLHGNPPPALESPTDEGIAALARQYIGYYGRWSISEDGASVTHHVAGALNPRRIGNNAVRPFRLCGDVLELEITSGNGREYYRRLERIEKFAEDDRRSGR